MPNNILILVDTEPVARFARAVGHNISGMRLDKDGEPTDFLLTARERDTEPFIYDQDVVELYSEAELRYFTKQNRVLFEEGLIKPYTLPSRETDTKNLVTDEELDLIVALRTPLKIQPAITGYSVAVLNRLRTKAEDVGLSRKALEVIDNEIQKHSQ